MTPRQEQGGGLQVLSRRLARERGELGTVPMYLPLGTVHVGRHGRVADRHGLDLWRVRRAHLPPDRAAPLLGAWFEAIRFSTCLMLPCQGSDGGWYSVVVVGSVANLGCGRRGVETKGRGWGWDGGGELRCGRSRGRCHLEIRRRRSAGGGGGGGPGSHGGCKGGKALCRCWGRCWPRSSLSY